MKLILQKDVKNLGKAGDQVSVKKGFARNFLIPKGLALISNKNRLKEWNHQKVIIEAKKRKAGSDRQALIDKLSSVKLLFEKESQKDNKIFGSVTAHEISQALEEKHNISVDKRDIHFEELKTVGDHKISIRLSSEHKTEILLRIKGKLRKSKEEKSAEKESHKKAKASVPNETSSTQEEANKESAVVASEKEKTVSSGIKTEDSAKTREEKLKPNNQSENITATAQPIKKAMTKPEELKNSEVDKKANELKAEKANELKAEKANEPKAEKAIKNKEQKTEEIKVSQANQKTEETKTNPDLKKSKTEELNKSTKVTSKEQPTKTKENKKSGGLLGKLFSSKK